jgi:hypothetical protein
LGSLARRLPEQGKQDVLPAARQRITGEHTGATDGGGDRSRLCWKADRRRRRSCCRQACRQKNTSGNCSWAGSRQGLQRLGVIDDNLRPIRAWSGPGK